jgi:hypothetical protein
MATVLITQCLQRDFVDPISPHDPLPNLLPVGYSEAARLQGASEMAGPSNSCHRPAGSGPPGREWDHTTST